VDYSFYCEEENKGIFTVPSIVLDPIDGTKELAQGFPECCMSLAMVKSMKIEDQQNWGWIFNPFTGLDIHSNCTFFSAPNYPKGKLVGFVSRSEWEKGLFSHSDWDQVILIPKGSIALKLAFLASGACDFIISKYPKNFWDIAAGTVLCARRGIQFYFQGQCQTVFSIEKYDSTLIWCRKEHFTKISQLFQN